MKPRVGYYRYFIVFLVLMGLIVKYMLKSNLSVAILAMVNNTAIKEIESRRNITTIVSSDMCPSDTMNSTKQKPIRDGPFVWDNTDRGIILGAFFYGYIVTELPGGWLSYRFGSKWIIGFGLLWTAILTLLTPLTIYLKSPWLIAVRILMGLGEGVAFPCVHGLFAYWIPPNERTSMPAITFAAIGVGTAIGFPFSAALCDTETGWPLVFYVFGAIGVTWFIIWTIFGSSTPGTSRWISEKERNFIHESLAETVDEHERPSCGTIPWLAIIKTPAAWSLLISHMSFTWGLYSMITLLPTYFKDIMHMNMSQNGVYSALPYLCFAVAALISGPIASYLVGKRFVCVGGARKIMDALGHVLPGIFLLLATVTGCNLTAAVVLMCLAVGTGGFVGAGSFANNLDLAGRFAGITFGIFNMLGSICGVVAPLVAGIITQADHSIVGWRIVFGIAAGFYWLGALLFVIFGKGKTAEWAKVDKNQNQNNKNHFYNIYIPIRFRQQILLLKEHASTI